MLRRSHAFLVGVCGCVCKSLWTLASVCAPNHRNRCFFYSVALRFCVRLYLMWTVLPLGVQRSLTWMRFAYVLRIIECSSVLVHLMW